MPVEEIRRLRPVHQFLKLKDDGTGTLELDEAGNVQAVTEDFDDNDLVDGKFIPLKETDNAIQRDGNGDLFVDIDDDEVESFETADGKYTITLTDGTVITGPDVPIKYTDAEARTATGVSATSTTVTYIDDNGDTQTVTLQDNNNVYTDELARTATGVSATPTAVTYVDTDGVSQMVTLQDNNDVYTDELARTATGVSATPTTVTYVNTAGVSQMITLQDNNDIYTDELARTATGVSATPTTVTYVNTAGVSQMVTLQDNNTTYTDSEIKAKYENNDKTNAFTDDDKTKLGEFPSIPVIPTDSEEEYVLKITTDTTLGDQIASWVIDDANFDGEYSSLNGAPTTISGMQANQIIANTAKISYPIWNDTKQYLENDLVDFNGDIYRNTEVDLTVASMGDSPTDDLDRWIKLYYSRAEIDSNIHTRDQIGDFKFVGDWDDDRTYTSDDVVYRHDVNATPQSTVLYRYFNTSSEKDNDPLTESSHWVAITATALQGAKADTAIQQSDTATPDTLENGVVADGKAGLMTGSDKFKLDGVAAGAEINVQSDWKQTDDSEDDYIVDKPALPETDPAGIDNDTTKEYILKQTDVAGVETLTWEEPSIENSYSWIDYAGSVSEVISRSNVNNIRTVRIRIKVKEIVEDSSEEFITVFREVIVDNSTGTTIYTDIIYNNEADRVEITRR